MANGTDRFDRLEKILKSVAADVGSVKRELGELKVTESRHFKQVAEGLDLLSHSVTRLQSDQAHLASAVGLAVTAEA